MRTCAHCRNERPDVTFHGELCGDCYARGVDLEGKGDVMEETEKKRTAMIQCPNGCGHECLPQHLWVHRKKCPKGPSAPPGGTAKAPPVRLSRKSKTAHCRCVSCPWRDLDSALAQDLVVRMILGGMPLQSATEITRDVLTLVKSSRP